jgi:hypothetical protein
MLPVEFLLNEEYEITIQMREVWKLVPSYPIVDISYFRSHLSYMAICMEKLDVPYIRVLIAYSRVMIDFDIIESRYIASWVVNKIAVHNITFTYAS